jgi:hypothetical protein
MSAESKMSAKCNELAARTKDQEPNNQKLTTNYHNQ